jgi:hypothetical protein
MYLVVSEVWVARVCSRYNKYIKHFVLGIDWKLATLKTNIRQKDIKREIKETGWVNVINIRLADNCAKNGLLFHGQRPIQGLRIFFFFPQSLQKILNNMKLLNACFLTHLFPIRKWHIKFLCIHLKCKAEVPHILTTAVQGKGIWIQVCWGVTVWFSMFWRITVPSSAGSNTARMATTHPRTHRHIPEDLNPSQHNCMNFTLHKLLHCFDEFSVGIIQTLQPWNMVSGHNHTPQYISCKWI